MRFDGAIFMAALCCGSTTVRAQELFPIRDQNPLLRGFYLPLPSDSRVDAAGRVAATLLISNTLNVESNSHERLLVDGESAVLDLSYENSLSKFWRYRLTIPIVRDSGGVLDSVIDTWHEAFAFSRGSRPYFPKKQIDYSYSGEGRIDVNHSQTHIGDLSADVGWYSVDNVRQTLSLWGGVKAPTGSVAALTSDGAWDAALWAHAAMRWTRWQLATEVGISQPFGDELFAGAAHRLSVFARLAATRVLGPVWSLRSQLDGQTGRVEGSNLRLLAPSLQLTLGAERHVGKKWRLAMGFSEDVAVNTAPDITFFLGIHD
ncbi:MAG: DUF3187 family protein [Pseudomonadota bacterium]|nr:DUF3187 family protein [Pseudomonadota bacterium]